jgi:putative FmdB family regulatory protein
MPLYTYRREDGTEFEIRQKFSDDPLEIDPETGQKVVRVIHAAGIVFKGSGFYVNDSKGSKSNLSTPATNDSGTTSNGESSGSDDKATAKKDEPAKKTETSTSNSSSSASAAAD